jgi:hypothetical protein
MRFMWLLPQPLVQALMGIWWMSDMKKEGRRPQMFSPFPQDSGPVIGTGRQI